MADINAYWFSPWREYGRHFQNFGDELTWFILENITGSKVKWVDLKNRKWYHRRPIVHTVCGSIIQYVDRRTWVWGNGILSNKDKIPPSNYFAVRGKYSAEKVKQANLLKQSPPLGDPALLLPRFYNPKLDSSRYIAVVPHYIDLPIVRAFVKSKSIRIVDLTDRISKVLDDIIQAELIVSSSLHGIIVAHAYAKKVIQVKFSNQLHGDGIKFADYYSAVNIKEKNPPYIKNEKALLHLIKNAQTYQTTINPQIHSDLSERLLSAFPFPA